MIKEITLCNYYACMCIHFLLYISLSYIAKKAIRVVSHSDYLSHTDPIFKELQLLTLEDMFTLQKFKFLHKLAHNTLPTYFDTYKLFSTRLPMVYNLRPHALALPHIYHVYAESCLVYQLVKLYNDTTYDLLILRKIEKKIIRLLVSSNM